MIARRQFAILMLVFPSHTYSLQLQTKMATKNIQIKAPRKNKKLKESRRQKRQIKIFVSLIKIPCKFVYGDCSGRNPRPPGFRTMCVVYVGCVATIVSTGGEISENLTKSYFICARQNSRATTPPKNKGRTRRPGQTRPVDVSQGLFARPGHAVSV